MWGFTFTKSLSHPSRLCRILVISMMEYSWKHVGILSAIMQNHCAHSLMCVRVACIACYHHLFNRLFKNAVCASLVRMKYITISFCHAVSLLLHNTLCGNLNRQTFEAIYSIWLFETNKVTFRAIRATAIFSSNSNEQLNRQCDILSIRMSSQACDILNERTSRGQARTSMDEREHHYLCLSEN